MFAPAAARSISASATSSQRLVLPYSPEIMAIYPFARSAPINTSFNW